MLLTCDISGLILISSFITREAEKELLDEIDSQTWSDSLSRRTQHYGYEYSYAGTGLSKAPEMPMRISELANQLSEVIKGFNAEQAIVNEYEPGQGISKHVDSLVFGDVIVSVSLGSDVVMEFAKKGDEPLTVLIPQRSVLILSGSARYKYTHCIPKRKTDSGKTDIQWKDDDAIIRFRDDGRFYRERRVSITFRTVA